MIYIVIYLVFLSILALLMPLNLAIWGALIMVCIVAIVTS